MYFENKKCFYLNGDYLFINMNDKFLFFIKGILINKYF